MIPEIERQLLSKETDHTQRVLIRVGDVNVELKLSHPDQFKYIERFGFPHIHAGDETSKPSYSLLAIKDESFQAATLIPSDAQTDEDGLFWGRGIDFQFIGSTKFNYLNLYWQEDGRKHIACVGKYPEYGLASYLKALLLSDYRSSHDAITFHAATIVNTNNQKSIVVSTADHQEERRRFGKTTTMLSCLTDPDRSFAFATNDELILGWNNDDLVVLPFPNEIPIRESALSRSGLDIHTSTLLEAYTETDPITQEKLRVATSTGLIESGYQVSNIDKISYWFFVDLHPDLTDLVPEFITSDKAKEMFKRSIFERRVREMNGELAYGEHLYVQPSLPENLDAELERMFTQLTGQGVQFILLTGGMNQDKMRDIIKQITNQ
ncbi:hypothetical protein A2368_01930 [Candidatus Collierbacteria bacterium RIFOXYB1_FULL_49_13]|uniref:Uncharacterized protein n=1 Tax=Candidatus Collierbacteria bacterium RIFOXYB1_FULL_49_13 TaxID=1817728 RepID=A0A1F5FG82_9BACT|nr:MAG: hypothetical protein A2368_01930 [Candidatus Collierbacteria bacterium RIFOXYB1_FULL_49_13]